METAKKIKIYIGILYLSIVLIFLWFFFSKFSLNELATYDFIKNNRDYIFEIKQNNFIITICLFIVFTIIWVLLLGFGSPVFLLGGFIFGKWFGTLIVTFSLTIGATILYLFASYFFKDLIIEKFLNKFHSLSEKFKKNEFIFFLIYRFVGGIPFAIANILPVLFNIKLKNYFFGTFLGLLPTLFIGTTLGSGIEKIINKNEITPSFIDIITTKDVYYPILGFFLIIIIALIVRKKIYKNKISYH